MSTSRDLSIAGNVRAEVARCRLRQTDLAHRLGLTQQALSRRLVGQVEFSARELRVLADVLNVPVTALYGEQVAS